MMHFFRPWLKTCDFKDGNHQYSLGFGNHSSYTAHIQIWQILNRNDIHDDWTAGNRLHLGDIGQKNEKCCTLILVGPSIGPMEGTFNVQVFQVLACAHLIIVCLHSPKFIPIRIGIPS